MTFRPEQNQFPLDSARIMEAQTLARLRKRRARAARPPFRTLHRPLHTLLNRLLPKAERTGTPAKALHYKWTEIVGPRLASLCQPMKITRSKGLTILHIHADSAAAAMLTHMGPLLLERVEAAGVKNLNKIRIHHTGRVSRAPTERTTQTEKPGSMDPEQLKMLAQSLEAVENKRVREALTRLAQACVHTGPLVKSRKTGTKTGRSEN